MVNILLHLKSHSVQNVIQEIEKVQKAEIKIQMAPHRPRKSTPTELTTDEEDIIMYDVQAEELEPNPEDKFAVMECFVNNPSEYMRINSHSIQKQ
ncbi:hypothetical protein TNCV_788481 [Trichonephila clavipes]|nr:hypothetical protein TNCV_788481 [Trichonephila clavipes]